LLIDSLHRGVGSHIRRRVAPLPDYFRRRIWQMEVETGGAGRAGGLMIGGKGIKMAAGADGRGRRDETVIYRLSSLHA